MLRYFSAFWWVYACTAATGFLLILSYLTAGAVELVFLFKVPLIGSVLVLVAFHLKYKLRVIGVGVLFAMWGVWATIVGVFRGTLFTVGALTHVYMTLMPIIAASFGYYFASQNGVATRQLTRRVMLMIFALSATTLVLYFFFFYVTKQISYFGFDSMLPLASAWLLSQRRYLGYAAAMVLVFFSGKRAALIAMFSPILLMVSRAAVAPRLANIAFAVVLLSSVAVGGYFAVQSGMLYRFEPLLNLDLSDYEQLYLATSGRSAELLGLWAHLDANPATWFTGSGFGSQYLIEAVFRGEFMHREQHYLHLAVLTYLLVFGAPFLLVLLGYVGFIFWRNRSHIGDFSYLAMVVSFVSSFFGAALIVEPVFWFFLGANTYMAQRNSRSLGRFA